MTHHEPYRPTPRGTTPPLAIRRDVAALERADKTVCPGRAVFGHEWQVRADGFHCIHCPLVVTGDDEPITKEP